MSKRSTGCEYSIRKGIKERIEETNKQYRHNRSNNTTKSKHDVFLADLHGHILFHQSICFSPNPNSDSEVLQEL